MAWVSNDANAGKHICIDSSWWEPGGVWKWVYNTGVGVEDLFPQWRGINGSGGVTINNGVSTKPAPPTKTKLTSYFLRGEPRQWKSTDGRSLLGTIIAFEESVIEFDSALNALPLASQ